MVTKMKYEVVCTKNYLDVGLLIEKNSKSKPKRVLARSTDYNHDSEYGGVEYCDWINTGVFLSEDEWKKISYNKWTNEILGELGIKQEIYLEKENGSEYMEDNALEAVFVFNNADGIDELRILADDIKQTNGWVLAIWNNKVVGGVKEEYLRCFYLTPRT